MMSTKINTGVKRDTHCFIKNRKDFSFSINSANEIICSNDHTFISDCKSIQLFIDGVVYNNNEDQLIQGFLTEGVNYINKVEGSFTIFLLSGTDLFILSDKANTQKAFYASIEGTWYISNNIDLLPKEKCHISLDGLACYLANGAMLNELTIYREIKSTQRACIHSFRNGQLSIEYYWKLMYKYPSVPVSEEELQKELEQLLVESIRCRVNTVTQPAVSLSAGYDARGIVGILHYYLKEPNITCFSYSLPQNQKTDSDSYLAKGIAQKCGYPHTIYASYSGNLVDSILNNAKEGKCLSSFCEELETWHTLAQAKETTDVFFGDEFFGYFDVPVERKETLLGLLAITGPSSLGWTKKFMKRSLHNQLCESLTKLRENIYQKAEIFSEPHDKKDFLYFDQRIDHVLLPWRENLCSQAGFAHNPYLDSRILEFVSQLPPNLRKEKIFFKNTIKKMLPDLFALNLAKTMGYTVDWQKEIHTNREALISLVKNSESLLDNLISKEEVIRMIKSQGTFFEVTKKKLTRIIIFFRKKYKLIDHIMHVFLGPLESPKGHYVFPDFLVLRLLLIRAYLSRN